MAMTKHACRDLGQAGSRDLDEFGNCGREAVRARKEVARDRLQVSIAQEPARDEWVVRETRRGGGAGGGWRWSRSVFEAVRMTGHDAATLLQARRNSTAFRAPVGSSSCLK